MLFLQMLGHLVKWYCDCFYFSSKYWVSSSTATFTIAFWSFFGPFGDYFSILSAGFSCTKSVVVYNIVLIDDELSVISMFYHLCCEKLNWNSDCKKIISHVRSLYFMFAKFVNLDYFVSQNEINNIFLPNVEIMRFGWYFWKCYLIKWTIW